MQDQIERIMERFNFERVHTHMKSVNWTWGIPDMGVPTVEQLKLTARDLLESHAICYRRLPCS